MNTPMMLTWGRVAAIPVLVLLFMALPETIAYPIAALLFALASLTDFLDGYLARRWQQYSDFGAFLDPVADKLIVAVALVLLVYRDGGVLLTLAVAIILSREIFISALREWMATKGVAAAVKVSIWGKLKTTVQMIAITLCLYHWPVLGLDIAVLGLILLLIAAVLTAVSGAQYAVAAYRALN